MDQTHTPELLEAAAQLERAKALMIESPQDYESFESCLQAVVLELRRVGREKPCSPEEVLRFRDSLQMLNCLFHGAESFYRGWSALAAVSDTDPALPSICVRA